jgi:hypothetical protein
MAVPVTAVVAGTATVTLVPELYPVIVVKSVAPAAATPVIETVCPTCDAVNTELPQVSVADDAGIEPVEHREGFGVASH